MQFSYYQKISDVILKRAKDYHKNDKERIRNQARDKYRNLSEEQKEEKNQKGEYERKRYLDISEEKKQKLKKYQKNYRQAKTSQSNNL